MELSIKMKTVVIFMLFILWLMIGCARETASTSSSPVKSISIVLPKNSGPVMQNIVSAFTRRVEERCVTKIRTSGYAELKVELLIEVGIGAEGFRITEAKNGNIRIVGNDQRGVIYGVGKFLRTSIYSKEGFIAGKWRGTSVPEKLVRGIYFATHFYNYYQTAPIEEVELYMEDLALCGINSLLVWYDIHHFNGSNDPDAVALRNRLKRIMQKAKKLDMGVGLIVIGNEGYANSPEELRALPGGYRGGNYPEVICPNKPGGLEYILKVFNENIDYSGDIQPEYICIWPYDQGGCGCSDCKPWGSNGFVKCARGISEIAREKIPGVKIILSTWYFDSTEWRSLSNQLAGDFGWVDIILAEDIPGYENSNLLPLEGNRPIVGFPEISMYNTFPWGGFGATPLPNHLLGQWQKAKNRIVGGFPYSEGIFEDISKFTYSQIYWNSKMSPEDILKEYISYEYSPYLVDDIFKVLSTLEQNHHMRWWPGKLEGVKLTMDWFPSKNVKPLADPGAEEAYAIVRQVDTELPDWARRSWRWRILYIRALLDADLKANGGSPNQACIDGFKELMQIYHTTKNTDPVVKPPIPYTGDM